jgi:hypothetical protein
VLQGWQIDMQLGGKLFATPLAPRKIQESIECPARNRMSLNSLVLIGVFHYGKRTFG